MVLDLCRQTDRVLIQACNRVFYRGATWSGGRVQAGMLETRSRPWSVLQRLKFMKDAFQNSMSMWS